MQNRIDGGEAILEAFRQLDVEYVISSPGSEWPSLWDAMARQKRDGKPGPVWIDCGHETIAVTMAAGYTHVTGRMQAVVLHAGAGLLQGSMALFAAAAQETPMVVMSGEALDYGEDGFDPGSQWYRNLSVTGGTQALVAPFIKFSQQVPSSATLYQSIVRAGELSQRIPRGPTYLCVAMETMMQEWSPPRNVRKAPPAPKRQPLTHDLAKVAELIASARRPLVITENTGRDPAAYRALVDFVDVTGVGVVEGSASFFSSFPKDHQQFAGTSVTPHLTDVDLVLLVDARAPWYPPSNIPENASVVCIGENPLKTSMAYQVMEASLYLEGDTAVTLELLTGMLRENTTNGTLRNDRRTFWSAKHGVLVERLEAAREKAKVSDQITMPALATALRDKLPTSTTFVDETIVYSVELRDQLRWQDPFGYIRAPSGLGQSIGYALGVKMALPERTVVVMMGDGTFLYNPVLPALTFAEQHGLPLLILVLDNGKYASMQHMHNVFYPRSVSKDTNDYYGTNIKPANYEQAAGLVDGFGYRVERAADLPQAIESAIAALGKGKPAILNIAVANYESWTR
ncbi:acetolactate synthase-1/2/3 large subunit [Bradyrhizobium sp. AZCC 1678]|uniref:thiamine pyrophosphate-dependent enzyme n=1 Tax=Bradyrhizobium sp. AZCC 1678 TaxID=3117030 RepID=UPI002FF2D380